MKYLFAFSYAFILCMSQLLAGDFLANYSVCPAIESGGYSGGATQFVVSNCFYPIRSISHLTEFKFIDVGIGSRFLKSNFPEIIGKFTFISGNYWFQKPIKPTSDSSSYKNNLIYKIGFNAIDLHTDGFYSFEVDALSINADICYNPNDANGGFYKANTYSKPGPIIKFSPSFAYSVIYTDTNSLANNKTKIANDSIEGGKVGLNLFAAYYFANNYSISVSYGYELMLTDEALMERNFKLRFTKEFFFAFLLPKDYEPRTKALELYCEYQFNRYGLHLKNYTSSAFNIGVNFYNYGEYLNAWEMIKHIN